ncbi:uncharacterized protein LOC125954436 [Anopheles darlingi]|uniref:uncharacterized protein LOC125954436 n=1 Tax=Anopheles darlingi TaxID=43151 RepID=UPI0021004980|nr:uncharacterized protein LOC125954436 [Anopheles darlingi]
MSQTGAMERERTGSLRNQSPTGHPAGSCLDERELEQCMAELDIFDDPLGEDRLVRKPHFLDYDNNPPAELVLERRHCHTLSIYSALPPPPPLEEHPSLGHCDRVVNDTVATVADGEGVDHSLSSSVPLAALPMNASCGTVPGMNASSRTDSPFGGTWPLKERQHRAGTAGNRVHHKPPTYMDDPVAGLEVGPKMECVYSLLAMLGSPNVPEMASKFLELSRNDEKCTALRRAGCVPVLVHIVHNDPNEQARRNARLALINVIRANGEGTVARRELKVLRLVDHLIDYTETLKEQHQHLTNSDSGPGVQVSVAARAGGTGDQERRPIQAICTLAKISYDEDHRRAMCQFGALQTIATLIQLDHQLGHGSSTAVAPATVTEGTLSAADPTSSSPNSMYIELRRYASMVLTNLTFGQGNNKALLCANREFMRALVAQLARPELVQVTASVLRNLSWRADAVTKKTLAEIGTVHILTEAAMRCTVENTLKSILSALWNLSNHCAHNRAHICEVDGAIEFFAGLLTYEAPSKTMAIVENAGGILRNISNHIAHSERYRQVLRGRNCLKVLLGQLKSPSLTVVSNACGTLGNLSNGSAEDQQFLRDNGAIPMLRSLIYSKHNIISNGSRLALRNLQQQVRPSEPMGAMLATATGDNLDPAKPPTGSAIVATAAGVAAVEEKELPCLNVRRQRAMEQEQLECAYYGIKKGTGGAGEKEEQSIGEKRCAAGRSELGEHDEDEEEEEAEDPCLGLVRSEEDEDDDESDPIGSDREPVEQPINYGLSDVVDLNQQSSSYDYQETDIDQLTDYSLRYAENQFDSDEAKEREEAMEEEDVENGAPPYGRGSGTVVGMLIPEDSVKCYYTEGTPQIISSATSMSDLRSVAITPSKAHVTQITTGAATPSVPKSNPIPIAMQRGSGSVLVVVGTVTGDMVTTESGATRRIVRSAAAIDRVGEDLGCNTPDKPYNYCEEGTPDFSRDASLSLVDLVSESNKGVVTVMGTVDASVAGALDGTPSSTTQALPVDVVGVQQATEQAVVTLADAAAGVPCGAASVVETVVTGPGSKSVSFLNTADETPLMFSRTSSMGSLSSAEPACTDDKSSIVSEFSRLASGVISPSELPDSPTQTIDHSPRNSQCRPPEAINSLTVGSAAVGAGGGNGVSGVSGGIGQHHTPKIPEGLHLPMVSNFADATTVTFQVEHTPALFSCATSLSNLSIEDDRERQQTGPPELPNPLCSATIPAAPITFDSDARKKKECDPASDGDSDEGADEELLASCISIGMSSVVARKSHPSIPFGIKGSNGIQQLQLQQQHRHHHHHASEPKLRSRQSSGEQLRLRDHGSDSDDSSSTGETADQSDLLLEECIRSGMPKLKLSAEPLQRGDRLQLVEKEHPIGMMRAAIPLPLPVLSNDECNRYQLEDSPCNFSTISGLSELTVGSDAGILNDSERIVHRRGGNDSLSSLSLESDNDDHLLDEAIAAGIGSKQQNRSGVTPNYHFPCIDPQTSGVPSRVASETLVSRPIVTGQEEQEEEQEKRKQLPLPPEQSNIDGEGDGDSIDSIDSIFANDPANDSLLEQAIESGMKGACMMTELGPITGYEFQAGMLYGTNTGTGDNNRQHHDPDPPESISEPHEDDYELLTECIYAGMQRKGTGRGEVAVSSDSSYVAPVPVRCRPQNAGPSTFSHSAQQVRPRPPAELPLLLAGRPTHDERLSKNVQTTPVMSSVAGAECESSAGVVAGLRANLQPTSFNLSDSSAVATVGEREPTVRPPCSTNIPAPTHRHHHHHQSFAINSANTADITTTSTIISNYYSNPHCTSFISSRSCNVAVPGTDHSLVATTSESTNARFNQHQQRPKQLLQQPFVASGIAGSCDSHAAVAGLGVPAKTTTMAIVTRGDLRSCSAECSLPAANGFEQSKEEGLVIKALAATATIEKHKDPELMLQSVERLTERLVSHTEYFRTDQTVEMVVEDRIDDAHRQSISSPTDETIDQTDSKPNRVPTTTAKDIVSSRRAPHLVKQLKPLATTSSIAKTVPVKHRSIPVPYTGRGTVAASSQQKLKPAAATQRSAQVGQDKPAGYRTTTTRQQPHITVPSHKPKPPVVQEAGKRRLNGAPSPVRSCDSNGTPARPMNGTVSAGSVNGLKGGRKSCLPGISLAVSAPPHQANSKLFRPPTFPGDAGLKGGKTVSSPLLSVHQKIARPSIASGELGKRRPGGGIVGEKSRTTPGAPYEKMKNKLAGSPAATAAAAKTAPAAENGIKPTVVKASTKARQRTFVFDRPTPIGNGPHIPVSSWALKRSGAVGQSETGSSIGSPPEPEGQQPLQQSPLATERIPKMSLPMYGNF